MTMTRSDPSTDSGRTKKVVVQTAVGLLAGAAFGAAIAHLDDAGRLERLDPFILAALLLGVVLAVVGGSLVALSYRRAALGAAMLSGEAGEATPREAGFVRLAGWSMLSAGLLAAAPPAALVYDAAPDRGLALGLVAALAAGTLAQAFLNWRVWALADELTRRASLEGAAIAFLLIEGVLFLWAAANVLEVAPDVSAWAIWTLMFAVYLVVAGWVAGRRGLS